LLSNRRCKLWEIRNRAVPQDLRIEQFVFYLLRSVRRHHLGACTRRSAFVFSGWIEWLRAYGENEPLTNQYYILQAGYLRKLAKFPVLLGEGLHTSMARPKSERSFRLHSNPKFRPSQLQ
jgi:hypothetical protein